MKSTSRNRLFHMVFIALMTSVICVVSPFSFPLPFSPVPLSLTTFILYLSVYLLGAKHSFCACCLYLIIGAVGIPVFSGFSGGFGKLLGPTGGYLLGYLCIPLIAGIIITPNRQRTFTCAAALFISTLFCYLLGTVWLAFQTHLSFLSALSLGVLPFLPGDMCKIILVLLLGPRIYKRLQKAKIL